jgi:hypothetical protein
VVLAQTAPKKASEPAKPGTAADTPKDDTAKKDEAAPKEEPTDEESKTARKSGTVEVFKDPRAEAALEVFKSVPGLRPVRDVDIRAVKQMAAGQQAVDRDIIKRFVDGMAYDLVDKTNINGLIDPPPAALKNPNARALHAIKEASDNLLDPLNSARLAKNTSFVTEYTRALLETMPKLLDNNLVARIEAMIVLGQTGSPDAVDIFTRELKRKDQTVWVKLWALRGLYNVVDGGPRVDAVLGADRAIAAGKAVVDFLGAEETLPWPVQMRAMEAIGAMRQAAVPSRMQKADMATAAMKYLADPKAPPDVRAAAAWALGMARVNSAISKYNFSLVAYDIGRLAAELGDKISASFAENSVLAERWTGLLVSQIYQAFNGMDGARESGLLHSTHPDLGPNASRIKQIADLESAVAKAAVEMIRAPGGQAKARGGADKLKEQTVLNQRVAALKAFLDKNPPKEFTLVPGGPEFRLQASEMAAEAPAERAAGVVGARGGR